MIFLALIVSAIGAIISSLLSWRYVFTLAIAPSYKWIAFSILTIIGSGPLLAAYVFEDTFGRVFYYYRHSMYFIYIFCVILLTITIFRDAIWGGASFLGRATGSYNLASPFSCPSLIKINIVTVIIGLIFSFWSLYEGLKLPPIKNVSITSEKILTTKKIAILSDLHIHRIINTEKIKKIVKSTNKQNPDVIILDGDIIDDEIGRNKETLAILKDLKAKDGIYFASGNHEFYTGYKQTVDAIKELGFTYLENNGVSISDDLYVGGIPDYFTTKRIGLNVDLKATFAQSNDKQYKILTSHSPFNFGSDNNFDLEVSGHTHGGQIFPFHIFAKAYNKYLAGLYDMDKNTQIYVSRGSGQWGPQMRFLAPSEITILNLTPKKDSK